MKLYIVPKTPTVKKSQLTAEASVRMLEVKDLEAFLADVGSGRVFVDNGLFHYVMDDGVLSAYDYFNESIRGTHASKRVGFDGTQAAVDRFLLAVAKHGSYEIVYADKNSLIGPVFGVVVNG